MMFHVEQRLTTVMNCFWRLGVVFAPRSLWGWWRVFLVHEGSKGSLRGRIRVLWRGFRGLVGIVFRSRVDRVRWKMRIEGSGWADLPSLRPEPKGSFCKTCPIYDAGLRRCRPYAGSPLGCGCYVPFMALEERPYPAGCWAKEFAPSTGFGWD